MDGRKRYDESGWHHGGPWIDPHADKRTLEPLEKLSNPLVTHGYPPLRGVALDQICRALAHRQHGG